MRATETLGLEINGVNTRTASNDDVYALVMEVAATNRTVEEITDGLRRIVRRA